MPAIGSVGARAAVGALLLTVTACTASTSGRGTSAPDTATGSPAQSAAGSASATGSGSATSSAPAGAALTDPTQAAAIRTDATRALQAVNSYDYRALSTAYAAGLDASTGTYRRQYAQAFKLISANAPKQRVSQRATVTRTGLGPVAGADATVLAVGQLAITKPSGRSTDPFTIVAHVRLVGTRWLLSQVEINGSSTGAPPGTADLSAAVNATRTGVASLLTFRRASFDDDYRAALAHTTGGLRTDVAGKRAATLATLQKGHFDVVGTVRAVGVIEASDSSVRLLVSTNGYRDTGGKRSDPTMQNLEVTVVGSGSRWLLSNLVSVGVR